MVYGLLTKLKAVTDGAISFSGGTTYHHGGTIDMNLFGGTVIMWGDGAKIKGGHTTRLLVVPT